MNRIKIILIFIVIALLLFVAVFFYGRYEGTQVALLKARPTTVSSQIILDRITSQYFLVTKTVFSDSKVEIDTPKNNNWTDLFVGKKIIVSGVIRTDVGVDMKNLTLDNIVVDSAKKTVTIKLPHAEILDSSLYGQLDFSENKAIVDKLKSFFNDTQNADYNLALQTLIDNAKTQVSGDEDIFTQARADSVKLVDLIVSGMLKDYQVVIEQETPPNLINKATRQTIEAFLEKNIWKIGVN